MGMTKRWSKKGGFSGSPWKRFYDYYLRLSDHTRPSQSIFEVDEVTVIPKLPDVPKRQVTLSVKI